MDAALQRRVQRYGWDKASAYYEQFWAAQLRPAQDKLLELAELRPGEAVIDIAAGTGLVTFRAAEAVGPTGRVLGTDISEKMVAVATEEAARRGLSGTVEFRRADAEKLAAPDGSFDAALCALGFMYVPDHLQALREMGRVLRPGGRAVAAVWGARRDCGWAEIFPIVERRVQSEVCPLFFQLGQGNALELAFEAAGFGGIRVARIQTLLRYASAEDALGAAFAGGPVALAYSRFNDETRESAHAEYLESIAGFREGEGYAVPGSFVVVAGVKA